MNRKNYAAKMKLDETLQYFNDYPQLGASFEPSARNSSNHKPVK